MPRVGLTRDAVVAIAIDLIDAGETPTLTSVAERAGVRTPSLYKHVRSLAELQSMVHERLLAEFARALDEAIGSAQGADAVRAGLDGIRSFAHTNPERYVSLPTQPLDDPRLEPIARNLTARLADAITTGHPESSSGIHTLRLMRSFADGWIRLELAGGFGEPVDIDDSWTRAVELIASAS